MSKIEKDQVNISRNFRFNDAQLHFLNDMENQIIERVRAKVRLPANSLRTLIVHSLINKELVRPNPKLSDALTLEAKMQLVEEANHLALQQNVEKFSKLLKRLKPCSGDKTNTTLAIPDYEILELERTVDAIKITTGTFCSKAKLAQAVIQKHMNKDVDWYIKVINKLPRLPETNS